jgi:DNA-binding YbaB/EbfC family protein
MFDSLKALGSLGPMMAKAREMQAKVAEVQARLPSIRATGAAGGGMVTATASGTMEIVKLDFSKEAVSGDPEFLADLTRAAVNQALKNVTDIVQLEMQQAAGGMDLGALKGMLGG